MINSTILFQKNQSFNLRTIKNMKGKLFQLLLQKNLEKSLRKQVYFFYIIKIMIKLSKLLLNLTSNIYKGSFETLIRSQHIANPKFYSSKKSMEITDKDKQHVLEKQQQPQEKFNPIECYDNQLFSDILSHKKRQVSEQANTMKRKEKLQKLRKQTKEDPQMRKIRNKQRHQKQSQKLQKQLQGMTEQQKRTYLDIKKKKRQQYKDRAKQYLEQEKGIPFIIDNAYEDKMNDKQNKSLAIQIDLIIKAIKRMNEPPNIYVAGLQQGKVKNQLEIMKYQHWPLITYSQTLKDCLQKDRFKGKTIYYLSPDAPQTLQSIEKDDVFIIGGLVDRSVIKDASFNRAKHLNVKARSLPIRPFMKQRYCLNLDHIVSIMAKFAETKDWKQAFQFGAPKRWKKDIEGKQAEQKQEKSDNDSSQENEKQQK